MPSVKEEYERLKWLMNSGKENDRCTPVVLVKQAAKERIANKGPKPKTKFIFETNSPEAYSEFNREKDRVLETCGNKAVAVTLLIRAWEELTPEKIAAQMAEGEGQEEKPGGPPKAVIPPWVGF